MISAEQRDHFAERGWLVVDLPSVEPVLAVRHRLLGHLRATTLPALERFDDYHRHVDDDRHVAVLHDLATFYWREDLGRTLVASHLAFFQQFVALDLHVQKYPYLRAVRPGRPGDAVTLHRDTYYGSSPYELSVWIPFADMTADSALRVVSGSHVGADADYPWMPGDGRSVVPRSPAHQLGFPYAPKLLDPALLERAEAVPVRLGQMLVFNLALVHGAGVNTSSVTRVSTDIRVVNSFAPIAWSHSVHEDYYAPLCRSMVSEQAARYFTANG